MKITPIAGSGTPGTMLGNIEVGSSVSRDRKEAAKRIFAGEATIQPSDTPIDELAVLAQKKRTLQMKTNYNTQEYTSPEDAAQIESQQNAIPKPNEEASTSEVTKPLSPQYAAIARQRRALQVKERELAERERAFQSQSKTGIELDQIKANPLKVLQDAGVSYDDLTQAILGNDTEASREIRALKDEVKALRDGVDTKFTERDARAESQVLSQIEREAKYLASQGDTYELVHQTKSIPDVVELIHRTWKRTGEVLDVSEALSLVEDQLVEDVLSVAKVKKIQSKLSPASNSQQLQPQERQMRTLTSRDSAPAQMSRRDRAIAAALGQLKRG